MDHDTDNLLQGAIRLAFADCTMLTVAHRLNTIMDADRVIVMDSGVVVEDAEPASLLERKNVSVIVYDGVARDVEALTPLRSYTCLDQWPA